MAWISPKKMPGVLGNVDPLQVVGDTKCCKAGHSTTDFPVSTCILYHTVPCKPMLQTWHGLLQGRLTGRPEVTHAAGLQANQQKG